MASYKILTQDPNLFFEQNIYDKKELQTYIDAIKSGIKIKLKYYKDEDGYFVKLARAEENEPAIQDYIALGSVKIFRRNIINYSQMSILAKTK